MKDTLLQVIKIVFFAFLIMVLQVAVLKEITDISINLPLVAIIAIASFSSLSVSIYTSTFLVIAISLLSYNSSVYWTYILVAYITNQFNPKNLEDKFLVAVFYCLIFSPIFELIYTPVRTELVDKSISVTLINLATLIPVYFILKLSLSQKKRGAFA